MRRETLLALNTTLLLEDRGSSRIVRAQFKRAMSRKITNSAKKRESIEEVFVLCFIMCMEVLL
jgi:hypothetical protein